MKSKHVLYLVLLLALVGLGDSYYLTLQHYGKIIPLCTPGIIDCGAVLESKYAVLFGVPLAVWGLLQYGALTFITFFSIGSKKKWPKYLLHIFTTAGFLASAYFVFLQVVVIGSICTYCMLSALVSFTLFYLVQRYFARERRELVGTKIHFLYIRFLKNIFFQIDAETIHEAMLSCGEVLGRIGLAKNINHFLFQTKSIVLERKVAGINFETPVGLAAGFDYEAKLTQFLPSLGFGFGTVGTITNMAYEGNPRPRLGRLPKSKSLLVNKGFKNSGATVIATKLKKVNFDYPVGISIGRSNNSSLKTQTQSVADIVSAFRTFESAKIKNAYYELNISCPNLIHGGDVTFYPPKNLEQLLMAVDKLKLKKPLFVKMPIEKTDREVLAMLRVIAKHSAVGVIFGNLQKDKKHPSLHSDEVVRFTKGYYSGKPTYERSNELIKLAYKKYKDRFVIIGCGGIFSAEDAYAKIKLGASLVQLITGLIYEGPQLVSQINLGIQELLQKDGYTHISEAVGVDVK